VQLGVTLNDPDKRDIVAFLESQTGELSASFATTPVLPSGVVVRQNERSAAGRTPWQARERGAYSRDPVNATTVTTVRSGI